MTTALQTAPSSVQFPIEQELAALIVDVLQMETDPAEIAAEAPLFHEGLGLDSIDALELALAISDRYGCDLKSDDARNQQIFASVRALARHIEMHRTK